LLDDSGPIANFGACNHIADLELYQVATAQLAIDGEIEKSFVFQSSLPIEIKTDRQNLLLG
jgi:hypothetical protein